VQWFDRWSERERRQMKNRRNVIAQLLLLALALWFATPRIRIPTEYDLRQIVDNLAVMRNKNSTMTSVAFTNSSIQFNDNNNKSTTAAASKKEKKLKIYQSKLRATKRIPDNSNSSTISTAATVAHFATLPSFIPNSSEWVNDIESSDLRSIGCDLITNRSLDWRDPSLGCGCGKEKCVFPSKKSLKYNSTVVAKGDFSFGYLLSKVKSRDNAIKAYHLAQELASNFSIYHGLLVPPIEAVQPLDNFVLKKFNRPRWGNTTKDPKKKRFTKKTRYFVQPVELYPSNSILVKCKRLNSTEMIQNELSNLPPTEEGFEETLRSEYNKTLEMINSPGGECMRGDFQIVIDPIRGRFVHIDIDRCLKGFQWNFHNCKFHLEKILDHLIQHSWSKEEKGAT